MVGEAAQYSVGTPAPRTHQTCRACIFPNRPERELPLPRTAQALRGLFATLVMVQ
jgi:hypothetical protein